MKTKNTKLIITLFATIFLFSQNVNAQLPIDQETGKVLFTGIVELPNQTKDIIHKKAKLWIISTLKSGDNMTELNDDNSNQLVGTGNLLLDSLQIECKKCLAEKAVLNFKFIVYCKDNKLKYSIENFILVYQYGYGPYNEIVETGLEQIKGYSRFNKKMLAEFQNTTNIYLKSKIDNLIANFISNMKKEEKNDW